MADRLKLTAVQKKADQSRFVHNSYGSKLGQIWCTVLISGPN